MIGRMIPAMIAVLALLGRTAAARADGPGDLGKAGVNRWVRLGADEDRPGYEFSGPVFVPSRGQLVHWGGVMGRYQTASPGRDDVRAFDPAAGRWVSDYAIDEKARVVPAGHGAPPIGVSRYGLAGLTEQGRPWPALVFAGGCYDSKRDQLVYPLPGMMLAYDVQKKTWRDTGAKSVIHGVEYAGLPEIYGLGACYDPVNDEIVLFGHWVGAGEPKNTDLREATGEVSNHLGTLRYRFADNTWRRASETFGSEQVRAKRKAAIEELARISARMDQRYVERGALRGVLRKAGGAGGDAEAKIAALTAQTADESGMLRALREQLDGELAVEPPARCGAPMVYVPEREAIVMFGGHSGLVRSDLRPSGGLGSRPGALNDTWLYDCRTRQWRQIASDRRPPVQQAPQMFYDPASKLVVLTTFEPGEARGGRPGRSTVWTLDATKEAWSKRGEQEWPWELSGDSAYASRAPTFNVGLDAKAGVAVFTQNVVASADGKRTARGQTMAIKLDVAKMPSEPAPPWQPDPPIVPQTIPADDPAWVKALKELPANTWTAAKPAPDATGRTDATVRDWGNAAYDAVRGHVYYFGGGHSTYQVNDVAIYAVGANRWVHAAGDHNDYLPATNWGGQAMGYRGGMWAHHQRNEYVAVDGRMYVNVGGNPKLNAYGLLEAGRREGPRWSWFYDLDRGGVWRQRKVEPIDRGENVDGVWSEVSVADPSGRVIGFVGDRTEYYGDNYPNVYVSVFDVYANRLQVRNSGAPHPQRYAESRPFCWLDGKDRLFWYEYSFDRKENKATRQATWVYDLKTNAWIDLKPKSQPPGLAYNCVYLADQDAVWAVVEGDRQWVYSFARNDWAELAAEGAIKFTHPYGQVVYAAGYGVLVSPRPPTRLMRPEAARAKWE